MLSQYSSQVKKRSRLLPILLVLLLAALAALSGLYYLGTLSLRVDGHLKNGLKRYDNGSKLISEVIIGLDETARENAGGTRSKGYENMSNDLERAAKELKAARKQFIRMGETSSFNWEKQTAKTMKSSAIELEEAVQRLSAAVPAAGKVNEAIALARDASQRFRQSAAESNKLILLTNSGRYKEVRESAPAVSAGFIESRALIEEAKSTGVRAETKFDQFLAPIGAGEKLITNLTLMADLADAGKNEDYNRLGIENNDLINQLNNSEKSPLFLNPEQWINENLSGDVEAVKKSVKNAKILREKALDLWREKT